MGLIDVEKLMPNAKFKGQYDLVSARDIVNQPTVDAIPVEWILHYVDTHYNVDNYDAIWRYIMKMHDEWEKESKD